MQTAKLDPPESAHLSRKETRKIVTPYAFHVSPDLFGVGLASPQRRAWAMLIDIVLIGMLTQVSSLILAGVAAATFFRAGNRLKQKKRFNGGRIFLRFLTAVLLFVVAVGVFETFNDEPDDANTDFSAFENNTTDVNGLNVNSVAGLALTAKYLIKTVQLSKQVEQGQCAVVYECWQGLGHELSADLLETGIPEKDALGILNVFSEASEESLSPEKTQHLQMHLHQQYLLGSVNAKDLRSNDVAHISTEAIKQDSDAQPPLAKEVINEIIDEQSGEHLLRPNPGLIDWLRGIVEDLGLGFGWAAFYFSIFTAWWKGQTPGKRLLGIKVLKLDGSGLNLWESFGRYGGYGAGLATGLSGFLQIYWDPNRQAIQDKISATLVIDLGKKKVAFELPNDLELK
ncbi:MAG: hypothetical protein ACI965_002496 [Paraglaciecola sp.]|jgi:hypothetical protein